MSQIILDSANDLIQGDFDNATLSQRTRLQTSTVNATTGVYVVPNGTATSASVQISNAADPTNASKVVLATNGSTDTQIVSGANGSGTYLPLSIYTNNDIRLQVNNSGALGVRTGPGTVGFGTSGQFLTSNGSGAGVSWTTVTVPPSGQLQTQLFTSPGTWTNPGSVTSVRVTVVGGGGGGGNHPSAPGTASGNGGQAGYAKAMVPVSAPVTVTVGAGGNGGVSGGTSSFGPGVSATGGATGGPGIGGANGAPGTGTVSVGTNLRSANLSINATAGNTSSVDPFIFGIAQGPAPAGSTSGVAFSASSTFGAGAGGRGGIPGLDFNGRGGIGGVVIVEWVG